MKRTIIPVIIFILIVGLVTYLFTFQQTTKEEQSMIADLQYRTNVVSDSIKEKIEPDFVDKTPEQIQTSTEKFVRDKRIAGVAIFDSKDMVIASAPGVFQNKTMYKNIVVNAMDEDKSTIDIRNVKGNKVFAFVTPLHQNANVVGALMILQNAGFIDDRLKDIWVNNIVRFGIQLGLVLLAIYLVLRWIIFNPLVTLVESIKLIRFGKIDMNSYRLPDNFFLRPLIKEVMHVGKSLFEARSIASEEARLRLGKIDSPWTEQRLKEFVKETIQDRNIIVVSNREPYIHTKNKHISYYVPASGMVTAIEPLLQACNGTWIAHGSGDADKLTVDKNDTIAVPPDDPKYTLHRVWLTKEEEKGYYYGFSNEGLWPLCHMVHTRPVFRENDWHEYKTVNGKFLKVVLNEIQKLQNPLIIIQDFHFAVLSRMIKNARPDAQIALFWHVPWPSPEHFSICPYAKELLDGMLGADLIGFHTQLHCNNFIETVGRELESLIDWERFSITKAKHLTYVKPFPISIPFSGGENKHLPENKILEKLGIGKMEYIGLGVDRLDYTKGILERLKAVELFLSKNQQYLKNFVFIQIAPPSRSSIEAYKIFTEQVEKEVKRINTKYESDGWNPIIFLKKHHSHKELEEFYRIANVCLVTSLHDGMNLVSKEFVASRDDEKGVLILSKFAGASRELKDALIVNPYDVGEVASNISFALQMSRIDQKNRMHKMRESILNNNVYRWSANVLKTLTTLTS